MEVHFSNKEDEKEKEKEEQQQQQQQPLGTVRNEDFPPTLIFGKETPNIVIIDLEATCSQDNRMPNRIISYGSIFCVWQEDKKRYVCKSTYHRYVKPPPPYHKLTEFCINLTGITQDIINKQGWQISNVIYEHRKQIAKLCKQYGGKTSVIFWGHNDLRWMMTDARNLDRKSVV